MSSQDQEISLLQGGNWQDRTKSHFPRLLRRQAFTEVGYRCHGVLLIWSKEVSVTRFDMFNGEIIHYTLYERPVLDMILEMTKGTIKKSARIQVLYCIPIRGGHISIKHINSCLRVMGYDKACRER